jgi:hypothetical protein
MYLEDRTVRLQLWCVPGAHRVHVSGWPHQLEERGQMQTELQHQCSCLCSFLRTSSTVR